MRFHALGLAIFAALHIPAIAAPLSRDPANIASKRNLEDSIIQPRHPHAATEKVEVKAEVEARTEHVVARQIVDVEEETQGSGNIRQGG